MVFHLSILRFNIGTLNLKNVLKYIINSNELYRLYEFSFSWLITARGIAKGLGAIPVRLIFRALSRPNGFKASFSFIM